MKLASWNVNGIRAAHKKGFCDWVKNYSFDVIGLQEVRADKEQIPSEILELNGYEGFWHASTVKKGYSGVGILTKHKPLQVFEGLGKKEFDGEGRVLGVELQNLCMVTAYFPNSQEKGARLNYKIAFCDAINDFLHKLQKKTGKPVILNGDVNVAHKPIDLARPDDNEDSPGYLPEERAWMETFLSSDWIDTFRHLHPNRKEAYSWWSARGGARARNVGWRIDYHILSKKDLGCLQSASIQDKVLGSDHCPVVVELSV